MDFKPGEARLCSFQAQVAEGLRLGLRVLGLRV